MPAGRGCLAIVPSDTTVLLGTASRNDRGPIRRHIRRSVGSAHASYVVAPGLRQAIVEESSARAAITEVTSLSLIYISEPTRPY